MTLIAEVTALQVNFSVSSNLSVKYHAIKYLPKANNDTLLLLIFAISTIREI